ncbi:MAG TPA: cupin domain-containing protein [Pyrinomonadaceae bacterium]|nr:cupin domain-containing protein [Pyrinomonadaceae bacterium]
MRNIIRISLATIAFVITFFAFTIYLDSIFIRSPKVDLSNYFQPGDKLLSRFEGFDQTVLAVNDGWVHTRLEVAPNAGGPPEHMHRHFTETFTVKKGTLSILINGEKRVLHEGETISIPPMTAHRPFNETNETVVVESDDPKSLPVEFAYHLTQMYGFMDSYSNGPPLPQMLMQLSVYGDEFDSLIVGPPVSVQKTMRTLIAPTARLMGYSNYYQEFKPKRG